jgi:hypothetical protein
VQQLRDDDIVAFMNSGKTSSEHEVNDTEDNGDDSCNVVAPEIKSLKY